MLPAIEYFHHLVAQDIPSAIAQYEELTEKFVAHNICFAGKAMAFHLRPHFLSPTVRHNLEQAAHHVLTIALKAELGLFGGDAEQLYEALGMSQAERVLLRVHPGFEERVFWTRLDAFIGTGEDDIKFLEFNHDAPAGIGYSAVMSRLFLELPLMEKLGEKFAVRSDDARPDLLRALLKAYGIWGGTEHPNIAIVDWQGVRTSSDFEILRDFFEANGHRTIIADPRALEIRAGKLYHQDFRIDLVYRRVVTSELLEKLDECGAFVEAYTNRLACFINSIRCRISENKAFMSFLTDPAYLGHLSAEERHLLGKYLPWTRAVRPGKTDFHGTEIDLGEHLRTERERFVLKPADAYGGKNVFVGSVTSQGDWETAVNTALTHPGWVVQERVPTPVEPFPIRTENGFEFREMKYNINPFYLGGVMSGAVTRTSTEAVINVSAGGGSIPTFVVAPK
ncbi:MAG: glutathionylspermidine synthase family protein [Blastocatellia bacterium]|nr:glutathionylspermidine synthase family protein [Blastocatellia bacterium]